MHTKTVTVVARETFPYSGVTRKPGDSFQAPVDDARILTLVGRVVTPSVSTSAVSPSPEATDDEAPVAPRRRSRRKDIVPED